MVGLFSCILCSCYMAFQIVCATILHVISREFMHKKLHFRGTILLALNITVIRMWHVYHSLAHQVSNVLQTFSKKMLFQLLNIDDKYRTISSLNLSCKVLGKQ